MQIEQWKPNPKRVLKERMREKNILAYITKRFRAMSASDIAGSRSTNDIFGT